MKRAAARKARDRWRGEVAEGDVAVVDEGGGVVGSEVWIGDGRRGCGASGCAEEGGEVDGVGPLVDGGVGGFGFGVHGGIVRFGWGFGNAREGG